VVDVPAEARTAPSGRFTTDCCLCPRLSGLLAEVRERYPRYYARPVASFGDPEARLLVVGLAPGLHGANATGRPFTGDFAGILLYETLYEFGFASRRVSTAFDDGLQLVGCRITNTVRCVPPQNKPTPAEIRTCNGYLRDEIDELPREAVILALGTIAHGAVLQARGLRQPAFPFTHGRIHRLEPGLQMVDSYHCSRYNTQTGRLTRAMFVDVFNSIRSALGASDRT
jgi:uracil-DNA glycosylase family 4